MLPATNRATEALSPQLGKFVCFARGVMEPLQTECVAGKRKGIAVSRFGMMRRYLSPSYRFPSMDIGMGSAALAISRL